LILRVFTPLKRAADSLPLDYPARGQLLPRDEEVGVVEDDADLALPSQPVGHEVRRNHPVPEVVGRHHADVVFALLEAVRHVVHEDQLDTVFGHRFVGIRGGDGVGGDRHDDVRVSGLYGLQVRDLLAGIEVHVGGGDGLDVHLLELGLQAVYLGPGPVVAPVVHDDRGRRVHPPDLF
jgi:hypothetical protein